MAEIAAWLGSFLHIEEGQVLRVDIFGRQLVRHCLSCEALAFLWGIRYLVRNSEFYARGIGGVFYHDSFWGPYLQRAAKLKLRKKRQCCRLFLTQFFAVPSPCVLDFCSTISFCVRFCNSGSVCNKVLLHHLCAPEIFAAPAPCVIFLRLQYCSVYSIHICGSGW